MYNSAIELSENELVDLCIREFQDILLPMHSFSENDSLEYRKGVNFLDKDTMNYTVLATSTLYALAPRYVHKIIEHEKTIIARVASQEQKSLLLEELDELKLRYDNIVVASQSMSDTEFGFSDLHEQIFHTLMDIYYRKDREPNRNIGFRTYSLN